MSEEWFAELTGSLLDADRFSAARLWAADPARRPAPDWSLTIPAPRDPFGGARRG